MIVGDMTTVTARDTTAELFYNMLKKLPLAKRREVIKRHPNFLKILMNTENIKVYYKPLFLDLDLLKEVKRGREMFKRIEETTDWLEKSQGEEHEQIWEEREKQYRALISYLDGEMPKRTAQRIIERSYGRVIWIVVGGKA